MHYITEPKREGDKNVFYLSFLMTTLSPFEEKKKHSSAAVLTNVLFSFSF